jgi:hypothetical protein
MPLGTERASGETNVNAWADEAVQTRRNHDRARSSAAGQGCACTTFPDTHSECRTVNDVTHFHIRPQWKRRMTLDFGPDSPQRYVIDIRHKDHGVRISH